MTTPGNNTRDTQRLYRCKEVHATTCSCSPGGFFSCLQPLLCQHIYQTWHSWQPVYCSTGFGSTQCLPFTQIGAYTYPPKSFNSIEGGFRVRILPQPRWLDDLRLVYLVPKRLNCDTHPWDRWKPAGSDASSVAFHCPCLGGSKL